MQWCKRNIFQGGKVTFPDFSWLEMLLPDRKFHFGRPQIKVVLKSKQQKTKQNKTKQNKNKKTKQKQKRNKNQKPKTKTKTKAKQKQKTKPKNKQKQKQKTKQNKTKQKTKQNKPKKKGFCPFSYFPILNFPPSLLQFSSYSSPFSLLFPVGC